LEVHLTGLPLIWWETADLRQCASVCGCCISWLEHRIFGGTPVALVCAAPNRRHVQTGRRLHMNQSAGVATACSDLVAWENKWVRQGGIMHRQWQS
jgi:hypothetical protein